MECVIKSVQNLAFFLYSNNYVGNIFITNFKCKVIISSNMNSSFIVRMSKVIFLLLLFFHI